jgi:prepilin signal peptidase PulO-like enzyme (type II secretory pathway)
MGALFAASYLLSLQGVSFAAISQLSLWLVGLVFMMILLIIDARTMTLPYKFLMPLIVVSLTHALVGVLAADSVGRELLLLLASLAVGFGVFLVLYVVSNGRWIGDGDVLFGLVIGFFLAQPFKAWLSIMVASFVGLVFGIIYTRLKKKPLKKSKIPFGPFLITGLIVAYLFGGPIIDWYASTVLFL